MLDIKDLVLGFNDAENYKRKENKTVFNQVFIKNKNLDNLMNLSRYFLIGEKGTGKTAYAVWLANNEYMNTRSKLNFIRETEYQKFIHLKNEKHLVLSDYTNIWKVTIYLLMAKHIYEIEGKDNLINKYIKFRALNNSIDAYYEGAFAPEIQTAIEFVEDSSISAGLLSEFAKAEGITKVSKKFSEQKFQTNLLYIQRKFEDALSSLKLKKNYTVFIDGIDLRPTGIPYSEYLECVKGLANAVWAINNDFFSGIKDSKGRMKVVTLLRPDIFNAISLQNSNNKIRDNSVLLDWRIPYSRFKESELFKLPNRLLSNGQDKKFKSDSLWDNYFPYTVKFYDKDDHSFVPFLRYSYYRPRDIVTMMNILQELHVNSGKNRKFFLEEDFTDPHFKRKYSEHLLGEVKDHLSFYYSEDEYDLFLKFFQFLKGKYSFTYKEYKEYYKQFREFIIKGNYKTPGFVNGETEFLQFLYELNIIFCIEEDQQHKKYFSYCFRERSVSNISPRVKTDCRYEIFYGLAKALNIGAEFVKS